MITLIASLINIIVVSIQSLLLAASYIGRVIVAALAGVTSIVINLITNFIMFFHIIYEDNILIFKEDIPNAAHDIYHTVSSQYLTVLDGVSTVLSNINYKFHAIISSSKWTAEATATVICEVLLLLRNAIIFLGNTIWFIVTFIPVQLPQILKAFFKNVADITITAIVNGYMTLLKVTNFLTDVPLESFIGIISAILITRLCIHFQEVIISCITSYYWLLIRKFWYYYYSFYNYFIDTEVREITRMSGHDLAESEVSLSASVVDDPTEALCVICQERQKCVLTLPCRHVCLCSECCMRLYGYQRTCPICRTFIYHSVTVYL